MVKFEGKNIAGKPIITYTPRGSKRYSSDDIGNYLSKFKLCDALKLIGELSYKISLDKKIYLMRNTPVTNSILAYLAMRLIERSNDYRSKDMTLGNLVTAVDMFFGLPELTEKYGYINPQGSFIRLGASQFDYERENHYLLPRALILYGELWNKFNKNQVDINKALHDISGLSLEEILVLGGFFTGFSEQGYFWLDKDLEVHPDITKGYYELDKQKAFVNWISCSYSEFRIQLKDALLKESEYEKFRFNPLVLNPVIIPDRNVRVGFPQACITPIPILMYERITRGLYFSLSDYFRNGKSNPFRATFGIVFQEYVGLLLKKTFGEDNVKSEWRYGFKKHPKDTPDWFVVQNGLAVLIEVKQSGLYLKAKQFGELEDIHKDLKQTIGSGVNQMWEFENDIENGLCEVPDWVKSIKITERLVITYDRPYFLNSILSDEVRYLYPMIPKTYHWHTLAVEELEYFLGIVGTNFIEALTEKRDSPDSDCMDFRDYYSRKFSQDKCKNPYLESVLSKFVNDHSVQNRNLSIRNKNL